MRRRLCGWLAALMTILPAAAGAQQNWSRLNPWQVLCEPNGGPCQIRNQITRGDQVVSHILIYTLGEAVVVEWKIPLGPDIREGVRFIIDRRERFGTEMLTCRADGCVGFTLMTTTFLRALADGANLAVSYTSADDDRPRRFDYDLVGFVAAYNTFYERQ